MSQQNTADQNRAATGQQAGTQATVGKCCTPAPCFEARGILAERRKDGASVEMQVDLTHRFRFRITAEQADWLAAKLQFPQRRGCVCLHHSTQPGSMASASVPVAVPRLHSGNRACARLNVLRDAYVEYAADGKATIGQIATRVGVSRQTVAKYFRRFHAETPPNKI